jgi:3-hydroxyisobutyrate dehydrogenase
MPEEVGLIGLGIIGEPIGRQLLLTGAPPTVYDVRADRVDRLVAEGANRAQSPSDVGATSDIVLVCVQTDEQCVEVIGGQDGVLEGIREGSVICVLSTVSPDTISELAAVAGRRRVELLDSPMAGRDRRYGELGVITALVGGDEAVVRRVRGTLERFSTVLHTGPLGSGAALKLAHNTMVYLGFLSTWEAVQLASAAGVRKGLIEEVTIATGTLSDQSRNWLRRVEARQADPGSDLEVARTAASLMTKDLRLAVALAAENGLVLPGCALAATLAVRLYGLE